MIDGGISHFLKKNLELNDFHPNDDIFNIMSLLFQK